MVTRVFLALLLSLVSCGTSKPDYRALCEKECACTGCDVSDCTANYRDLAERQQERSCRKAGDAVAQCKLGQGGARCDSAAGLRGYMPTEKCRPQLDAMLECFQKDPKSGSATPERVGETQGLEESLQIFCDVARRPGFGKLDVGSRAARFGKELDERAGGREFKQLFENMASARLADKKALLEQALASAKISKCASFDYLFPPPIEDGPCVAESDCKLSCPDGTDQEGYFPHVRGRRAEACMIKGDGTRTRHGPYVEWHASGALSGRGSYENGRQHGEWVYWFDNGQKRIQGSYLEGAPDGSWSYWYIFGARAEQATFVGGKKNGPATLWDTTGKARSVVYRDNQLVP